MAKSWMDRLRLRRSTIGRRKRVGWLSRIDGVERPALLVGLGMLLYRAWKAGDPGADRQGGRWRVTLRGWRQRLETGLGITANRDRARARADQERPARPGAEPSSKLRSPPAVRAGNPPL